MWDGIITLQKIGLKGTLALQKIVMKVPVAEIFTLKYPMLTVYKVSIVTWYDKKRVLFGGCADSQ